MTAMLSTDFVRHFILPLAGPISAFRCVSDGGPKNRKRLGLGAGTRANNEVSVVLHPSPESQFERYVKDKRYIKSLDLLPDLASKGYTPEHWLCARLISELYDFKSFSKDVEFIENMVRHGTKSSRRLCRFYHVLIRRFIMENMTLEARSTFYRMVNRGISPLASTYDAMIKAHAQKGELHYAKRFYEEMRSNGWKPSPQSHADLLEATVFLRGFDEGLKFLGELALRGMQPNGMMYFAIAMGLCKQGNPDLGLEYLRKAEDSGFLTMRLYGATIRTLWEHGNQVRALHFTLEMLEKGLDPDMYIYRTLIYCLCIDGLVDEAKVLLRDMDRTRIGPDSESYRYAIAGLCMHNRVCDAIDLLSVMLEQGCWPRQGTYICLLRAISRSGLNSEALQLVNALHSMEVLQEDSVHYLSKHLVENQDKGRTVNSEVL